MTPWKVGLHWYVGIVGGYSALAIAAAMLVGNRAALPDWVSAGPALAITLLTDPGPLGEEFGWRGFALPRLLKMWPPLPSTLALAGLHTLWHAPLFFVPTAGQSGLSFPVFTLGILSIAVIDTWIFLRTRPSLLLAILVHLMVNFWDQQLAGPAFPLFVSLQAAAALLVVLLGGLRDPRPTIK